MFDNKTVFELKAFCRALGIETQKNSKKVELLQALEDTGLTEEEILSKAGKQFDHKEAQPVEKVVEVIEKQEVKTSTKEKILIKMIHPRGAYNVGNGIIFTIEQPFKLVSKAQAEDILRRAKNEVREATPEEVISFYGVEA